MFDYKPEFWELDTIWFKMCELFRRYLQCEHCFSFDCPFEYCDHPDDLYKHIEDAIAQTYSSFSNIKKHEGVKFDLSAQSIVYEMMSISKNIACCTVFACELSRRNKVFQSIFFVLLVLHLSIDDLEFGRYKTTSWNMEWILEVYSDYMSCFCEEQVNCLMQASYDWLSGGIENIVSAICI